MIPSAPTATAALDNGSDISPYTGSVAGINDHRQMALGADHRDSADIQSISGGRPVGADAAFTENDV